MLKRGVTMKAYIVPELKLLQFQTEDTLTYSNPDGGGMETPIIPVALPQVDLGQ